MYRFSAYRSDVDLNKFDDKIGAEMYDDVDGNYIILSL